MQARDIAYGAAGDQMGRLPKQESYDRNDVSLRMIRVASDVWDRAIPTFYFSGVAMLVGGLLAAFGAKRPKLAARTAQSGRPDGIAPVRAPTPPGVRVRTGRFHSDPGGGL
jgi:hypothetical protein